MTTWVFRQTDTPGIRERLFKEAKHGRLLQGWSYGPRLSLEVGKTKWLREYRRIGYKPKHKPEPTYRDLAKMLEVLPSDLIIVPKQPGDDSFFVARAIANPLGQKSQCYCFFSDKPMKTPWGTDFRSCLTIDPNSLRVFQNDDSVPPLLRKALFGRGAWYRSKIQRIKRHDLTLITQRLIDVPSSLNAGQYVSGGNLYPTTDANPLAPFVTLADSDYIQTIPGGKVVRSRSHQTLVNVAAARLTSAGANLVRRGRIDLFVAKPFEMIIEAKILHGNASQAIREGIGQLFWYRFEQGLSSARLCLLLDRRPAETVLQFLEHGVGISVVWKIGNRFISGPQTKNCLQKLNWLHG